jgi:hypothetical protein
LRASWHPSLRTARPIVFDLISERWTLDPTQRTALVEKKDTESAPARVHCSATTLLRLLTEPGFRPKVYELFTEGDVSALDPLFEAFQAKQNVLALRANTRATL